jgi:hypothetical protein
MVMSWCHNDVMELTTFVETLRHELVAAAEPGGDQYRATAERLIAAVEPAVRLAMLEALSAAADEITRDLAPGSVHVRLRGREPTFVVTPPAADPYPRTEPEVDSPPPPVEAEEGATARINVRLGEQLKHRIEQAAGRAGLSVNAWLGRAAAAALDADEDGQRVRRGSATGAQRYTGWVR